MGLFILGILLTLAFAAPAWARCPYPECKGIGGPSTGVALTDLLDTSTVTVDKTGGQVRFNAIIPPGGRLQGGFDASGGGAGVPALAPGCVADTTTYAVSDFFFVGSGGTGTLAAAVDDVPVKITEGFAVWCAEGPKWTYTRMLPDIGSTCDMSDVDCTVAATEGQVPIYDAASQTFRFGNVAVTDQIPLWTPGDSVVFGDMRVFQDPEEGDLHIYKAFMPRTTGSTFDLAEKALWLDLGGDSSFTTNLFDIELVVNASVLEIQKGTTNSGRFIISLKPDAAGYVLAMPDFPGIWPVRNITAFDITITSNRLFTTGVPLDETQLVKPGEMYLVSENYEAGKWRAQIIAGSSELTGTRQFTSYALANVATIEPGQFIHVGFGTNYAALYRHHGTAAATFSTADFTNFTCLTCRSVPLADYSISETISLSNSLRRITIPAGWSPGNGNEPDNGIWQMLFMGTTPYTPTTCDDDTPTNLSECLTDGWALVGPEADDLTTNMQMVDATSSPIFSFGIGQGNYNAIPRFFSVIDDSSEIIFSNFGAIFDRTTGSNVTVVSPYTFSTYGKGVYAVWRQGTSAYIEKIGNTAVPSFLSLLDTPATYIGEAGKFARVNVAGTALEFVDPPDGLDVWIQQAGPGSTLPDIGGAPGIPGFQVEVGKNYDGPLNDSPYGILVPSGAVAGETFKIRNQGMDWSANVPSVFNAFPPTVTPLVGGLAGAYAMSGDPGAGFQTIWEFSFDGTDWLVSAVTVDEPSAVTTEIGKVEVEVAKWTGARNATYSTGFPTADIQTGIDFTGSEYIEVVISWGGTPGSYYATGRVPVSALVVGTYTNGYLRSGNAGHGITWGLADADLSNLRFGARGIVNPGTLVIRQIRGLKYVDQKSIINPSIPTPTADGDYILQCTSGVCTFVAHP